MWPTYARKGFRSPFHVWYIFEKYTSNTLRLHQSNQFLDQWKQIIFRNQPQHWWVASRGFHPDQSETGLPHRGPSKGNEQGGANKLYEGTQEWLRDKARRYFIIDFTFLQNIKNLQVFDFSQLSNIQVGHFFGRLLSRQGGASRSCSNLSEL